MNNTIKKIVASITVLTCAGLLIGPGVAQALTVEELLALIAGASSLEDLQADIAAAQAGEEEGTVTIEGVPADFTFETNLKLTSTGDDVKYLQIVLNSDSATQLAASGVGSAGNETSYFGPLTKGAVIKFQEKYTEDCLASWGLTEGTGYVGSTTRAKLNELLVGAVVPTGCGCTDWEGVACGGGDCLATEMQQTRTCEPEEGAAEDVCEDVATSQCVEDETCVVGEGLTVALAADTPVTTAIPYDSSSEFLKFTLLSDEDVNISSITITAGGLGTYTNIDNVAIFDEDGIRVSSTKNVSSDGNVVFNFPTLFAIEAGVLQTLTVKASIPQLGASSVFYLGISASLDILSDASAVNGTFPINGNPMNVLNVTVGTATITAAGDLTPTVSFGEDDVLLADFDIDVGAAEDLLFSAIRFRNGGTNDDSLASNLRLICDGEEIATTELEDRHADFSISNLLLEKSDTITCEVRGDIGTGSVGNTIQLYLKYDSDVTILCKNTGLRADIDTSDLNTITEAQTVTLAAGDFTIDFDKSSATGTPNQELRPDTNNVVLATLKMTSNAENTTIESITGDASDQFEIQGITNMVTGDITAGSVEMRDVDTGAIYDLEETWNAGSTEWRLTLSEEISLLKGVTKTFEIRVDLDDEITDEDTLKIVLEGDAMTITGDVSGEDIDDILPSSITSGISTVEVSSLTVTTTTLTNVSVVPGATDVIIYQGSMEAGDSSLVTLKTVTISEVSADTYTAGSDIALFSDTNITKLDLYLDGALMKTRSNRIAEATSDTAKGSITFSSLDTNNVISAGATVSLVLKATFASTLNAAGTFALGITSTTTDIISRDVDNDLIAETITSATTAVESRTVTLATVGTLKVDFLTTDIKANKDMYVVAGSSGPIGRYLGELVFTTANEPVRVTELRLVQEGTTDVDDIVSVSLVEADGDVVVTRAVNADGNVVLTNASLEFPANEATSYFIVANTKGINVKDDPVSTATSGNTIQYSINATDGVVAEGVDSGEDIVVSGITLLETSSTNTATWSATEANDGNYSVDLAGDAGWSNAMIAYGETLETLVALTATKGSYTVLNVEFNVYAAATGVLPFAVLYVDEDDDGTTDTVFSGGFDVRTNGSVGIPTGEWTEAYKMSAATWVLENYDAGTISTYSGGCYGSGTATLAAYLADADCADARVTYVGYGTYGNTATSYVDDVVIGDVTYSMEASNIATVLGGAVTLIENDMADAALTPGAGKIIGKYKVFIDTGSNRNTDNTPMEVVLTELKITLSSSLTLDKEGDAGTSVGDVRVYIEGDSSNKTPALGETDETTFSTPEYTISLDSLTGEAYKVTEDVVLVIVALVEELTGTAGVTDYLQTEIDALSTDFTYTDGTTTALDKLTINEVIGATLTE